MSSALASLLSTISLRELADDVSFARGEEYFEEGRVHKLEATDEGLKARVRGTRDYRVRFWSEENRLRSSCSCPASGGGPVCKHAVAVALAWLSDVSQLGPPRKCRRPSLSKDDVRKHLWKMDKEDLVDLLMERAEWDEKLSRQLSLLAAKQRALGPDLQTYRRSIDQAVMTDGFVDYGRMYDYVRGIDEVVDQIAALLADGHAEAVIELAEHALAAVEEAISDADDSNGGLHDILERLQRLHLDACARARPDVEQLAERLLSWELRSDYDVFHESARTYAEILGKKGLAAYRKLAEGEWAKVPALGPGDDDDERYGDRYRITSIMECLAEMSGDLDEKIAVFSRDLSRPYAFLKIAQICQKVGREHLALEWAERGLLAFPTRTDWGLREFLAEAYQKRGRHAEAVELVWQAFLDAPHLPMYEQLADHAKRANCWPVCRDRALALLRASLPQAGDPRAPDRGSRQGDHSDLVRIFLWEKNEEAAWAEAQAGGCSEDLWIRLAGLREQDHPEDALPIYRARVEPLLHQRGNDAYTQAIRWLDKVRRLSIRLNRQEPFARDLATLRGAHKAKRNFVKLLDAQAWT